jgi:hypothetical protein
VRRIVRVAAAAGAIAMSASMSAACSPLAEEKERETACPHAPRPFARQAWSFSGSVDDVAVHCSTIYVAGSGTIGQRTGPLALVSGETGRRAHRLPSLSGEVGKAGLAEPLAQAIVEDGSGGWFVGGAFAFANERRCSGVVRILRSGMLDSTFCPRTDSVVHKLARHGDTLYLAGSFTYVGGKPRSGLAAVSVSGRVLPWAPRLDPALTCPDRDEPGARVAAVNAIAASASAVYIGGFFSGVAGVPREALAAVDPESGTPLAFAPVVAGDASPECGGPAVREMVLTDSRLVVAGDGLAWPRPNFVRALDPTSGVEAGPELPGLNASTLAVDDFTLYVGGAFGAAAFDLRSGSRLPWYPRVRGEVCCYYPGSGVWSIVPVGDVVYLGGAFARVGGIASPFAAKVTARIGRVLPWDTRPNGPVLDMGRAGDDIVMAGGLSSVNVEQRFGLVAIDGPSGRLLPWAPRIAGRYGPGGGANALAVGASRLYVGGNFLGVDGQARQGLAAFDLGTRELVDWRPALGGDPTYGVLTLDATSEAVFAGGDFRGMAPGPDDVSEPRVAVAALAADSGDVLDWDPSLQEETDTAEVREASFDEDVVYLAGDFDAPRVGALGSYFDSGSPTDWDAGLSPDSDTNTILSAPRGVYVGGSFGLMLYDRSTGEVAQQFAVELNGLSGVEAIALEGRRLFVAGDFTRVGRARRAGFAAVDAITGRTLPFRLKAQDVARFEIGTVELAGGAVLFDGYIQGNGEQFVVQPLLG